MSFATDLTTVEATLPAPKTEVDGAADLASLAIVDAAGRDAVVKRLFRVIADTEAGKGTFIDKPTRIAFIERAQAVLKLAIAMTFESK